MRLPKYSKLVLENAVSKSLCITDVVNNMGLVTRGANHKSVKKWIGFYSIDISHFDPIAVENRRLSYFKDKRGIPLENILVKNSSYKSSHLKERLYKEGIKDRKCEHCGIGEIWRGSRMSLILDHIDGNHSNNELNNLRILCPNCNATLPTHCGKNKATRCYCRGCGVLKKSKLSDYCKKCVDRTHLRKVKDRPSIDILTVEIEQLGYVGTGKKYGVSDNAIRKWLKNTSGV